MSERKKRKPNKRTDYICVDCGDPYSLARKPSSGYNLCKKCLSKKQNEKFYQNHPDYFTSDEGRERKRKHILKSKYGLEIDKYNEMLNNQNGVCAICNKKQNLEGQSLCVDHDHSTGKIRGLLCHKCNQALGLLGDSATRAAQYLIANSKRSWDEYFMHIALITASRSKDQSTRVGAVIVRDKVIISTGYNGFPRNIDDDIEERHQRPQKYNLVCHAEENAIFNALNVRAATNNSDIYVTLYPCAKCTRAIIQCGIKTVYYLSKEASRWEAEFKASEEMLNEAGIPTIQILI